MQGRKDQEGREILLEVEEVEAVAATAAPRARDEDEVHKVVEIRQGEGGLERGERQWEGEGQVA